MADDTPTFVADSLALAVVASSEAPTLLLDGSLTVMAASHTFSRAFQIDPATTNGHSIFALGGGEWNVPQLQSLLRLTLAGDSAVAAYEMDLNRPSQAIRRLIITARVLDYADTANVRLLLAASDVTDARLADRLKDELLREKAMLYQELQHRVANSLQIIASVLMQSARRVASAEVRGHLFDAHSRVMSVASLQHQLVQSSIGDVPLKAYFHDLCNSIGAAMIRDRAALTLQVEADDSVAAAEVSVSLGLIVTELVINALKHAFPEDHGGRILVRYKSSATDWVLSVDDDGVGMPSGSAPAKQGLGTSIVQALAKQLDATVSVRDAKPGARVKITHGHAGGAARTVTHDVPESSAGLIGCGVEQSNARGRACDQASRVLGSSASQ